MASMGTVTIEITPEIREAIDQLVPVVRAAVAFVEDAESGQPTNPEHYGRLTAAVHAYKRFKRENSPIKAVK